MSSSNFSTCCGYRTESETGQRAFNRNEMETVMAEAKIYSLGLISAICTTIDEVKVAHLCKKDALLKWHRAPNWLCFPTSRKNHFRWQAFGSASRSCQPRDPAACYYFQVISNISSLCLSETQDGLVGGDSCVGGEGPLLAILAHARSAFGRRTVDVSN